MLFEVKSQGIGALIAGRARRAEADADAAHRAIGQWQAAVAERDRRIGQLQEELAVEKAHAAGFEAQVLAFAQKHPNSPLMTDSGQRYQDNDIKRRIRLIYEAAFDATLRKLLPRVDPVSRRAD